MWNNLGRDGGGVSVGGSRFQSAQRPFKCLACEVWLGNYDLWVSHLTSSSHQSQVTSRPGNYHSHEHWKEESIRDKCMIVSGVKNVGIGQLITSLSRWGILMDIIPAIQGRLQGPVEQYYVQFDSEDSVLKVLNAQSRAPHQVQGQQIFFRRKYERTYPLQAYTQPTSSAVSLESEPKLYKSVYPRPSNCALGKVATQYRDESESALGLLQQTYGGSSDLGAEESELDEEIHDLFSQKMSEHFAKNLSHLKLEDQLEEFTKNILLSPPFLQARFKLIQELQALLKLRYPKSTIYPQGPDYIGIGNSDDSVLLYVDLFDNELAAEKQPWEQFSDNNVGEIFKILKLQQENARFCKNLKKIEICGEEIPTITFTHLVTLTRCTIRAQNFQTVQESMLVKFLCMLDPRVRPLLVLVRYWSSYHKIFDDAEEGMRNRLLIFLMIFHLANRKVIPSLSQLQALDHKKIIWNNKDISFCGEANKIAKNPMAKMLEDKSISSLSILSLLKDFFQRFGVANLKENAVCLWPAKFIQKSELTPGKENPILTPDFAQKLKIGADGEEILESINHETPMCVQSFFDMTSNLTSDVGTEAVKRFQIACWKTSEKLEEILNSSTPYLMNIFIDNSADLVSVISVKSNTTTASSSSSRDIEVISVKSDNASVVMNDDDAMIEPDPAKQENMNIEWEEFSKSLEQPAGRPLSFLTRRPVAPVAPSPSRQLPNPLYVPQKQQSKQSPQQTSQYAAHQSQSLQLQQNSRQAPQGFLSTQQILQNSRVSQSPAAYFTPPSQHSMQVSQGPSSGQFNSPSQQIQNSRFSSSGGFDGNQSVHSVLLAKPPLKYGNAGEKNDFSWEMPTEEEENSSESESEDEDMDQDMDEDDDEEMEKVQTAALMTANLNKPFNIVKIKLANSTKRFFLKAVQPHEFAYGGRGKMQSLFLSYLKMFNTQFWTKCFGFDMELDPPYQSVAVGDYANFNNHQGTQKRKTLAEKLDSVPNYEEPYSLTFYCQTQRLMNRVLCARKNDFINGKYIRRQIQPLLAILMSEGQPGQLAGQGNHFQQINGNETLSFKCHFVVTLDYQDLHSDCIPSAQLIFEKAVAGYDHLNQLYFLSKVFEKMASLFINRCFKCWLGSSSDFDLQAALRFEMVDKQERNRLANLDRKGKLSKRKLKKKLARSQARAAKASALNPGQERSVGQQMDMFQRIGQGQPQGQQGREAARGGGRRNCQVPASWNRSGNAARAEFQGTKTSLN